MRAVSARRIRRIGTPETIKSVRRVGDGKAE